MLRQSLSSLLLLSALAFAAPPDTALPDVSRLRVQHRLTAGVPSVARNSTSGEIQVIVRLSDPPLAAATLASGRVAKQSASLSPQQQRDYIAQLRTKQDQIVASVQGLGGREVARFSKALNAVVVSVDSKQLAQVSAMPGVKTVHPVIDLPLAATPETIPYVGASSVQSRGYTGLGIRVGVVDSGIDYTHKNLGGPGTAAAFLTAYGSGPDDVANRQLNRYFPSSKVAGGYDFVGENWPNGPLAEDPNPVDIQGHGTHVADILGGRSNDGSHVGVAPGTSLYAIRACSSLSTTCSGIALLKAVEFALDPNGDGDVSDALDVLNFSLGSFYGQRENDLSAALGIVVQFGTVVVAAAGNDGDRPYVVGSPAAAPGVIAVAQTEVPSAFKIPLVINSPASIRGVYGNTAVSDFAPIQGNVTANVAYVGRGCPGDRLLDNPSGKIALVDRGNCPISVKVDYIANAGAVGALIGLVAPGDAVPFSNGGGSRFVPSLTVTLETAETIRAGLRQGGVNATISESEKIFLRGSVVSTSSRGPSYNYNYIKPEIGAPGATVSAIAGRATEEVAFGGTSGASPMVAGSAALLLQKNRLLTPTEIKALLMNTAETNVFNNLATQPGVLAPISRIGAGELRVDRAVSSTAAAWDGGDQASGTLSFGELRLSSSTTLRKKIVVRNYADEAKSFSIRPAFRYADDQASGALTLSAPSTLSVPANGTAVFTLATTIDPLRLPRWTLDGGRQGGTGSLLQTVEYDGYVTMTTGTETLSLPWHVLPHKAANVRVPANTVSVTNAGTPFTLQNRGGTTDGAVDVFALTGTGTRFPAGDQPRPGDDYVLINLRAAGVRPAIIGVNEDGSFQYGVQFGISTFPPRRSHPNRPAEFDVYVDADQDGQFDYVVYNAELGGSGVSGQNAVYVANLRDDSVSPPLFYTDADLNSGNLILTVPLENLGLQLGRQFTFSVRAYDNYFTGALTDRIENMKINLAAPAFATNSPAFEIPVNEEQTITLFKNDEAASSNSTQSGFLFLYRDAKADAEAELVSVTP